MYVLAHSCCYPATYAQQIELHKQFGSIPGLARNAGWPRHAQTVPKHIQIDQPLPDLPHECKTATGKPQHAQMAKLVPKTAKLTPKLAKLRPKMAKLAPKTAKLAPKMAKLAPKMAKLAPKTAKLAPKTAKLTPKTAKLVPKMAKLAPRMAKLVQVGRPKRC